MKFSAPSILLASAAWTVQAIPTAIPTSLGGRARGLPYNAVRSIHQSQRKVARQESTVAGNTPVPEVTSVMDVPTPDPLPTITVEVGTSDPAEITSVADIPTPEPSSPITTNVITSEQAEITSVAELPTTEPVLPPTTTAAISSGAIIVSQSFLVKVRQGGVTVPPTDIVGPVETLIESPTAVLPTEAPVETFVESPATDLPTDVLEPVETFVESTVTDLPTQVATAVETFVARSPYTNTTSTLITTS